MSTSWRLFYAIYQLVTRAWHHLVELQVRLRHAATQNGRHGPDQRALRSYRSISILSIIFKLLEQVVSSQLVKYLKDNDLHPAVQSAYRTNHSTEAAVLKVLADILTVLDSGDLVVLTLLDLSAYFDSVDHSTLLRWL